MSERTRFECLALVDRVFALYFDFAAELLAFAQKHSVSDLRMNRLEPGRHDGLRERPLPVACE